MADLINTALIQRIARLARLGVSTAEAESLAGDVASILSHFEALALVDIDNAPEWHGVLEHEGTPATDEAVLWPQPRNSLLPLTEHAREGFFVVPAILERPTPGSNPQTDPDPGDDEDVS